jgi:ABC-type sugar transport system ATPase subunit
MNAASSVLELHGISKSYGPVRALRGVSLAVRPGEVIGLIGDNGAGKSTLISIISGFAQPDRGQILVNGVEKKFASATDARNAGIETVFQALATSRRHSTSLITSILGARGSAPALPVAGSNGQTGARCGARWRLASSGLGSNCRH